MKKKKKLSAVLKSKKFFILLKNHSLYPKYETKLKSLGAVISPFLDKEVNYVLTDTPGCNGKVSLTAETLNILSPSCYSVSPATPVSGDDCCATKKTRTRAEAMLERIPAQTQTASLNPIADAVSWNIPVYSIEFFQKWLDKKLSQFQAVNEKTDSRNETNARTFEKKYLKLESVFVRNYRPEFKEVSKWPSIDINTLAGSYPFDTKVFKKSGKKENENKKKEGERMNRTCNKTANDAGYCEICAVHYSDLSQHVASSSHIKFTCDDKNYADIDNCIKTRSVEAFLAAHNSGGSNSQPKETNSNEAMGRNLRKAVSLHLNNNENSTAVTRSLTNAKLLADESLKQPLQVQCNGFTNYHLRKTSTKSDSAIIKSPNYYGSKDLLRESRKPYSSCPDGGAVPSNKESHNQLSPATKEENVHRLRSRKSLFLPSILLGTTAEDGPNKIRAGSSPQTPTSNHFLRSSASPKSCQGHYATRSRLPGAPNSAEDDIRKSSVASPGSMKCTEQANASGIYFTRSKLGGSPNDAEGKRHSRGSVSPRDDNRGVGTNGRKRKLSVATSDDEEGGSASASPRNLLGYHTNRKMMKNNACNNDAAQMNSQKKRLSCEEKFLEDNREYYKVEMLRTKLRSTEFYCNQEINQTVPVPDTLKESDMKLEPQEGAGDDGSNGAVDDEVIEQQTENGEPVVMRFKKIKQRKSALSLLNLEAENFLFGPPKKMDTDDESDSSPEQNGDDTEMLNDVDHRNSIDGKKTPNAKHPNNPSARRTKAKKRRTHAEVFIHDNLDYYRFEISGSRLRHQNADGTESTASSVKNEPNEKPNDSAPTPSCSTTPAIRQVKVKEESVTDEENDSKLPPKKRGKIRRKNTSEMDKEPEQVKPPPASEPTNASSTEKEPEEGATRIENVCCVRSIPAESLHFSFESVPSKEPWYKTFVRYDTCNENYIPVPNTISRFQKISNIKPAPTRSSATPSAAAAAAAVAASELNLSPLQRRRRRSKLARIIAESKPRKSPRCHASTLAILSSLTNHRRRSRKIHAAETRRSQGESRGSSSKHETSETGLANSSTATAPKASASSQANSTLEFEARLKEAVTMLAKDVDEHFIEVFSNEDCRDKYLNVVRHQDQRLPNSEHQQTNDTATNAEFAHCCMQLDESIFQDQDFLNCYVDGTSDIIVDDMATFMNEAQLSCNSMETALDEELIIPRSNDLLSRLCRENDNSCNSSDCGASSTCEFLGFADDGRTVSRKRKRKRPNMTGWPQNSTRRRRQIRFADIVQRGANESPSRQSTAGSADTGTDTENVSEADSECTDDDMPLSEIASKKRRRGASSSCDTSSPAPKQPHDTSNEKSAGRASSRRTSKTPSRPNSLPHRRRGKRGRRRI